MTGFQPPCSNPLQGPGGAAHAGAQVAPPCTADHHWVQVVAGADLSPEPVLCPPRAQGPETVCGLGDLLTVLAAPPPQDGELTPSVSSLMEDTCQAAVTVSG